MIESFADYLPLGMILTLVVLLFSGIPVALVLIGVGFGFAAIGIGLERMNLGELFNITLRIYGNIGENLIYPAVPMLLFMGLMLERSGMARDLLLCLQQVLRRLPANLAISVALLGLLLAPAAGMIGASVATLALVAMPTMLAQGYRPSFAAGSIAAAGTLGIIFPPAIMLFFLADLLGVRVSFMFLAPIVPVLLMLGLNIVYMLLSGLLAPHLAPAVHVGPSMPRWQLFTYFVRSVISPALLIALILGSIVGGFATPTQSGSVGAVGALLLTAVNRRLSFTLLQDVLRETVFLTCMVFFVVIGASAFSYPFRSMGGDTLILNALESVGLSPWATLALILSIVFLLGFVLDWIEIALISLPIFYPVIAGLDFSAYFATKEAAAGWIAVLIAIALQTSFMTPPFGFALFFLKGAAPPSVSLSEIYRGVTPFVLVQVVVLLLAMAFPVLVTWLPNHYLN